MKLSRRDFVHAGCTAVAAGLSQSIVDKAEAYFKHGYVAASQFNNGKSQINFNFVGALSGEYPFMNLMKNSNLSTSPALRPDEADANGWPTVRGVNWVVAMPTQLERAGNYDLSWIGTGVASFIVTGGMTVVSGSLTPVAGVGHAVVIPVNNNVGTSANGFTIAFSGPAQNVQFCHVNDLAALALNPNEFHPQFMSVLRSLNCGVLRFLNWLDGNGSHATNWASRTPTTYSTYAGSPLSLSNYGGPGSLSGTDISVSTPSGGFTLQDKARLQFFVGTTMPSIVNSGITGTFTNTQTNITVTAHGLVTGNQVYLGGSTIPTPFIGIIGSVLGGANTPKPTTYFVTVIDANTITLSSTSGGSAITCTGSGSCSVFGFVTMSVGGGPKTPVFGKFCTPYPMSFVNFPSANSGSSLLDAIYDATFGAFYIPGSTLGSFSVPPEVCLDLCFKIGAHPWLVTPMLACDPVTDWLTELGTYIQTTYQNGSAPWMVPRFETPNELWNTAGTLDTQYAAIKAELYGWTNTAGGLHNWIGKVASIGGQQLANVFGGGNLGTKYWWVVGVQTTGTPASNSNARLGSTLFLSSDPNPVQTNTFGGAAFGRYAAAGGGGSSPQNWVSHICVANYFSPLERFQCQELIDAFSWYVTNAGNPTAQAALANGYVNTVATEQATVTVTNGSVDIVWTAHGLSVNNLVVFLTTPPAGFTIGLPYYVKTVVDANTITLSATSGGTVITPTGSGSPTLAFASDFNLAANFTDFVQYQTWASGFGVTGLTAYEGGWSPDYLSGNWSTGITGATQANPCVLTLASTSGNSEASGLTGNPAVVGMAVVPSSVGGMTQLNLSTSGTSVSFSGSTVTWTNSFAAGQAVYFTGSSLPVGVTQFQAFFVLASGLSGTGFEISTTPGGSAISFGSSTTGTGFQCFAVTAVSGNQITLNVDSTAFTAYTSGGTLTYAGSVNMSNALRGAGKSASNLQALMTQDYNLFTLAGGLFPSCFQLGDIPPPPSNDVWSILDDVYQPFSQSAQALAIQAYN